jgi:hypothetical protein
MTGSGALARELRGRGFYSRGARGGGEDLAAKQPDAFTWGTTTLGVRARREHRWRRGRACTRCVALGSPTEVASRSVRTRRT